MHAMQHQMSWREGMNNQRLSAAAPTPNPQEMMARLEREGADTMQSLVELSDSLVTLLGSESFFDHKMSADVRKQVARLITQQIADKIGSFQKTFQNATHIFKSLSELATP